MSNVNAETLSLTSKGGLDGLLDSIGSGMQSAVGIWNDYTRVKLERDIAKTNAQIVKSQQATAAEIAQVNSQVALANAQAKLEDAKNIDFLESLFGELTPQKALIVGAIVLAAVALAKTVK